MNRAGIWLVLATLTVGGQAARAGEPHNYEIAANDGYGLADCLAAGSECGQVVADSWCEAHGHGHALAFGPEAAFTGRATRISMTEERYVVTCGD